MGRAGACLCARVSRGDRSRTCPLLCPLESSLRTGVLGGCHPWGSSSLRLRAPSPHCHLRQAAVPKFPCPSPREKLSLRSPCLLACPRPALHLPAVTAVTGKAGWRPRSPREVWVTRQGWGSRSASLMP